MLKDGQVTPEELARVQASILSQEQAPSSRQQLGNFANWKQIQDQLGQPFNNERVPLNKLKLMRRDPMIAFGLHFTKTPIVRAPWFVKSSDVQLAAFIDGALRPIMPSLMIQILQKLEFGFQAIAKRFTLAMPDSTYIDPASGQEINAWEVQPGNVQPVVLKPFVALPPEGVNPIFDEKTGEFGGIMYKPPQGGGAPAGTKAKSSGKGGSEGEVEIDIMHSLWVTNEKDSVFGNIFGYPRLGYAYPYWWSYWFRWAIGDRAFERKGDPATLVRYPEGEIDLGNGQTIPNNEYALMMGDRLRSGSTIALPSTPYLGLDDKPSTVPEWDIDFIKDALDFDPFDKSFDYIDVMKLRSIFVPEQALIEGGGGTSSRNVAKEMYQGLVEAQSVLMGEIVETVNRYVIPHLIAVNFPDLLAQGVSAKMETRGFQAKDMELLTTIIQLIGQGDPDKLGVDIRGALSEHGIPLMPSAEYDSMLAQKAAEAVAAGPGEVKPTKGAAGVVPTEGKKPATAANGNAAASATGFAYVQPEGYGIELSNTGAEYLANLPPTMHYGDTAIRASSRALWNVLRDFYRSEYQSYIDFLENYEGELHLTDEEQEKFEFAPSDFMKDFARRLVTQWSSTVPDLEDLVRRTSDSIKKIVKRAAFLTRKEAQLPTELSDTDAEVWTDNHVADTISKTIRTTRNELEEFTANFMAEGNLDPVELSKAIQANFQDFPEWKADRYARTETRDAFNAGVLLQGQVDGLQVAQAVDARYGPTDADCEDRDGQFYTITQALAEDEHPNGTLGWRLIEDEVNVERTDSVPGDIEGLLASWDEESRTIYLSHDIDPKTEREYLLTIGERIAV